ncbi:MAG: S9 family peptidase [Deltaproteobacteria bacterium]|nr:S9 family peptidase [Deltaproteobacteria bacterium]
MNRTAPYGSWKSPLSADQLARAARRVGQPRLQQGNVLWLEGRPDEGGRQQLMRARPGESPEPLTPESENVRTRVHEYGGGDYGLLGESVAYIVLGQDGIQRLGDAPVGGTLADARYADLVASPDGRFLVAVEELPREGKEPENRLVAFGLATGERRVLVEGRDFVAMPAFSPQGDRLACIAWDHPNMPWDGTDLLVLGFGPEGPRGAPRRVAGGPDESIFQPRFSPAGVLTWISDRSGWWNLEQLREGGAIPVCAEAAEFGRPLWVFGLSSYDFESEDRLLCIRSGERGDELVRLDLSNGNASVLATPFNELEGLRVERRNAVFLGASPTRPMTVCRLDLDTGQIEEIASAFETTGYDPALWSVAQPVRYASTDGREAHAFLYRPTHPETSGPAGEAPPLLVKSHGGPTAATGPALRLGIQYWTSRGFAVMDVNYAGSTGYGRAYRNALRGAWGVADVDDCCEAAAFAVREGASDAARLAITGGSAGGYTTLCALTFRDVFGAGASHYGIGDLEALVRDTHKFEARYLDRLVGPYPEARERYRERSPIHFTERLSCPAIFLQGLDDPIVPPNQAEAMVAALAARGIPHAHVTFAGEGHGFRVAENICKALESELVFYSRIFGFPVDASTDLVIPGL